MNTDGLWNTVVKLSFGRCSSSFVWWLPCD